MTLLRNALLAAAMTLAAAPALAQEQPAPAAIPPAAPSEPATPTEPAQAATPKVEAGRVAAAPAGKGQVVFFRESKLGGMALSFSVHEGDKGVGKLSNGSYFVVVSDPGQHTFTIQSEATDRLTLEVESGETYYVKQSIGMGIMMGRPHLTPSDQAEFDKAKLKESTKTATDLGPKG
jgi:hypothetical protein